MRRLLQISSSYKSNVPNGMEITLTFDVRDLHRSYRILSERHAAFVKTFKRCTATDPTGASVGDHLRAAETQWLGHWSHEIIAHPESGRGTPFDQHVEQEEHRFSNHSVLFQLQRTGVHVALE